MFHNISAAYKGWLILLCRESLTDFTVALGDRCVSLSRDVYLAGRVLSLKLRYKVSSRSTSPCRYICDMAVKLTTSSLMQISGQFETVAALFLGRYRLVLTGYESQCFSHVMGSNSVQCRFIPGPISLRTHRM
jgi:hypothetical protein